MSEVDAIIEVRPIPDDAGKNYGTYFGYPGSSVEWCMTMDSAEGMRECIRRGFVSPADRALDNASLIEYAGRKGAVRVQELLRSLGYPEQLPIRYGTGPAIK